MGGVRLKEGEMAMRRRLTWSGVRRTIARCGVRLLPPLTRLTLLPGACMVYRWPDVMTLREP
jgi:hypothetical protein